MTALMSPTIVRNAMEHQDPANATCLQPTAYSKSISVRPSTIGDEKDMDSDLKKSNLQVLPKPIRGMLDALTDTIACTFTDLSRQFSSSEDQQEVLRKHRDSLRSQLETKIQSYDDLKNELKNCQTILGQTIDSDKWYRREHNTLQAKITHYRTEHDRVQASRKKLAEENKALHDDAAYHADRAEKLKAGCFQLEQQAKDEKAKKDEILAENTCLGTMLRNMQDQLQVYQKRIIEAEEARKHTQDLLIKYQQDHDLKLNEIEAIWRTNRESGGEMLEIIKASTRNEDVISSSQPNQSCAESLTCPPPPDDQSVIQNKGDTTKESLDTIIVQKGPHFPDSPPLESSTAQPPPPPPTTPTQSPAPPLPTPISTPPSKAGTDNTSNNNPIIKINGKVTNISNTPNQTPTSKKRSIHDDKQGNGPGKHAANGNDKDNADGGEEDDDDPIIHPTKRARRSTAKSR